MAISNASDASKCLFISPSSNQDSFLKYMYMYMYETEILLQFLQIAFLFQQLPCTYSFWLIDQADMTYLKMHMRHKHNYKYLYILTAEE